MSDKRKKRGFFDELFDDDNFTDIEDLMEHIMDKFGIDLDQFDKQPFFYGFSVSRHPGEETEIREFGNIFADDDPGYPGKHFMTNERKPLIDIFEIDEKIHVMAELPDINKEDISLDVTETSLKLDANGKESTYSQNIELPSTVDPDSAKASYRNGVLEVIINVKELGVARSVDID